MLPKSKNFEFAKIIRWLTTNGKNHGFIVHRKQKVLVLKGKVHTHLSNDAMLGKWLQFDPKHIEKNGIKGLLLSSATIVSNSSLLAELEHH